jgi:putative Holliday junction resolvase
VRVLGIDFGLRRIGLALSDASGTLASPLTTLVRPAPDADAVALVLDALPGLASDEPVERIVVGLPRRLDGRDNEQTSLARAFAETLAERSGLPVALQDERLSSREAESRLALRERDWRKRKARLDAAAAAVILQDWLDTQRPVTGDY